MSLRSVQGWSLDLEPVGARRARHGDQTFGTVRPIRGIHSSQPFSVGVEELQDQVYTSLLDKPIDIDVSFEKASVLMRSLDSKLLPQSVDQLTARVVGFRYPAVNRDGFVFR